MNEQEAQVNLQQPNQHNHKVLYTSLGLLFGAVVMLLIVVGGLYYKEKNANLTSMQNKTQDQAVQPENQTSQVMMEESITPMPIATKQELDAQLDTLDNTDTAVIIAGLDQNSADASQFSQ